MPTHVTAPSSTNLERFTSITPLEGFDRFCGCTAPTGTAIGSPCVKRGGQRCPEKVLNYTDMNIATKPKEPIRSYDPLYENKLFFFRENQETKSRASRLRASFKQKQKQSGTAAFLSHLRVYFIHTTHIRIKRVVELVILEILLSIRHGPYPH